MKSDNTDPVNLDKESNDQGKEYENEHLKKRAKLKAKRRCSINTENYHHGSDAQFNSDSHQSDEETELVTFSDREIFAVKDDDSLSPAYKKLILELSANQNKMCIEVKKFKAKNKANEKLIESLQDQLHTLQNDIESSKQWQNVAYLQMQKMTEYNTDLSTRFAQITTELQNIQKYQLNGKHLQNDQVNDVQQDSRSHNKTSKKTNKNIVKTATPVIYGDTTSSKKISERRKLQLNENGEYKIIEIDENNDESTPQNIQNNRPENESITRKVRNNILENGSNDTLKTDDLVNTKILTKENLKEKEACKTEEIETIDEIKNINETAMNESSVDSGVKKELTIEETLREAAENVVSKSGFTYDENSGMYYDWNTKMYYDPSSQLYYDYENGIYYYYDSERQSYIFHSQIQVSTDATETRSEEESRKYGDKRELSDGELCSDESETSSESENQIVDPCIRAVVVKSETLEVGTLFIITCQGGMIGRHPSSIIRLNNELVSRKHAKIIYEHDCRTFFIHDQKTVQGTYLNNERIADHKAKSDPIEITHRDYVTIVDTTLAFHVHVGNKTCNDCEPGNIQAMLDKHSEEENNVKIIDLKKQRKNEMKSLMKKYGLSSGYIPQKTISSVHDRAEERRKTIGSDPYKNEYKPVEKASVNKEIAQENIGFKMLSKMGWKSGEGLGKNKQGISEPVAAEMHGKNQGLGFGGKINIGDDQQSSRKKQILIKTKERFENIEKAES